MRSVWQFPIPTGQGLLGTVAETTFEVNVPNGAKFLTINRNGKRESALYFEVDPNEPVLTRRFAWIPTGGPVPDGATYLGTFDVETHSAVAHWMDARLLFHVYEL